MYRYVQVIRGTGNSGLLRGTIRLQQLHSTERAPVIGGI